MPMSGMSSEKPLSCYAGAPYYTLTKMDEIEASEFAMKNVRKSPQPILLRTLPHCRRSAHLLHSDCSSPSGQVAEVTKTCNMVEYRGTIKITPTPNYLRTVRDKFHTSTIY